MPECAAKERKARRRGRHAGGPDSETIPGFFARGINFYKLFWVFFIAALLGCVIEMVFCFLVPPNDWENRSGVLYGPFSLVWGFGGVIFTLLFHRLAHLRDLWIFLGGAVVGGAYEYLCSWFQEVAFGTSFWDYSQMSYNLHGRVNLLYCFFWGIAAMVWVKDIYPRMCRWIGKIPNKIGKPLTWALAVFMLLNTALSAGALLRMDARRQGLPPANAVERFLDVHYPDEYLQDYYPNMVYLED